MQILQTLFVVSHNGFEQIAETFVAAGFVLARNLQQQAFQLVEAAQAMARDGIRETRAEHHELVLAFAFRRTGGPPYRVVETAQLAACTRIQIVHAADHDVGLVIQIKAVTHQLVEIDFGRPVEPAFATMSAAKARTVATRTSAAFSAAWAAMFARTPASITTGTVTSGTISASGSPSAAFPGRAILAIAKEFGSFDGYIWAFVGGSPKQNRRRSLKQVPARTAESDAMSKDLQTAVLPQQVSPALLRPAE